MPILYKPTADGGWMPFSVRTDSDVRSLLSKGFRRSPPGETTTPADNVVNLPVKQSTGEAIKINSASITEISKTVKGVGMVTAKKLIEARPFKSVEDLIAFKDDIDWMAIAIDYDESPTDND